MLQYLINATAIWVLSLIVFDTLLRRETYHAYNRTYLLATLLAGALIPLLPVHYADVTTTTPVLTQSLQQVTRAKTAVSEVVSAPQQNWTQWLVYIYAAGIVASLLWLVADILILFRLHRSGRKTKHDGWNVFETGTKHTPFSFANMLYVTSIAAYSSAEWNMLCAHERRHANLLHVADLILMHFARIVFWFHPLVYIYHRRLLMVHEYQADSIATTSPKEYGIFLVEQAILGTAPSITHSFNRSPIKNRIVMLTRKSHSLASLKKLAVLPLLAASVFYCTFVSYSQGKRKNTTVTFANSSSGKTTYSAILADPVVRTSKPGCSVESCMISVLPKGEDIFGPFRCPGGQLHPRLVNYFKAYKGENMRIFIEDIMLTCNGNLDSLEMPLVRTATEKL
jgi:bla regulator protein blaR1